MRKKTLLYFILLYAAGTFLSLNLNSKYKLFTYKSTLWADAAGYYVYLPATFIQNWDYNAMPKGVDTLTGRGFELQEEHQTIFTKYTSGIAYLQAPFFLAAHAKASFFVNTADGFSQTYVDALLFSGIFYLLAALFLLFYFLTKHFNRLSAILSLIGINMATNLYYYGIEHPGLSHVYSFFLCSAALFLISRFKQSYLWLILPIFALLVLIRPTNIILVMMLLTYFFSIATKEHFRLIQLKNIILPAILAALFFVPQLYYWKYVSGNWITYSYKGEGFTNWNSPKILEVLFAPKNGLITNAPILLFAFAGYFFKPLSNRFTFLIFSLFALLVYVNASWWSWHFGCAYGGRAFIDYYPFLAIGLACLIQNRILPFSNWRYVFYIMLIILVSINLMFIYHYDDCWNKDTWDFRYLFKVIIG